MEDSKISVSCAEGLGVEGRGRHEGRPVPESAAPPPVWQLSVDTGGTFTDCVAVDPRGRSHHAKVLSSSALRGTVVARLDGRRLKVGVTWEAPSDLV